MPGRLQGLVIGVGEQEGRLIGARTIAVEPDMNGDWHIHLLGCGPELIVFFRGIDLAAWIYAQHHAL